MTKFTFLLFLFTTLLLSCSEESEETSAISIISITIDGVLVSDGENIVTLSPNITITFDAAVSPDALESAISINNSNSTTSFSVSYSNSNSQVTIIPELSASSKYTFSIQSSPIGANQAVLYEAVFIELLTDSDLLAACTSASVDCYRQLSFKSGSSTYAFNYFSTFPITDEVNLNQIDQAIILIHGANRNSDEYFAWLNNTLADLSLTSSTLLIAPFFKSESESSGPSDLYWNSNDWREGAVSNNEFKISSFAVVDTLLKKVAKNAKSLKRLVVTGHSSGGLFTHVYAASNKTDSNLSIAIDYLVANSQYFYYPGDERVNESNDQLFLPSNCNAYNLWPFGFSLVPSYLSNDTEENINQQFVSRSIYYILGNGNQSDPSLNTSDCSATLLGSSRYNRGENMFKFMELKYPDNTHSRVVVNGIGHNGQAIYQSEEFKSLLLNLLN